MRDAREINLILTKKGYILGKGLGSYILTKEDVQKRRSQSEIEALFSITSEVLDL